MLAFDTPLACFADALDTVVGRLDLVGGTRCAFDLDVPAGKPLVAVTDVVQTVNVRDLGRVGRKGLAHLRCATDGGLSSGRGVLDGNRQVIQSPWIGFNISLVDPNAQPVFASVQINLKARCLLVGIGKHNAGSGAVSVGIGATMDYSPARVPDEVCLVPGQDGRALGDDFNVVCHFGGIFAYSPVEGRGQSP